MTDYGVQPTGFVRKPLTVILAEIEAANITEFGPGLIQTSQSPMGQINGLFADLTAQLWELVEDVYQSYDPDQAEGTSLDTLGRIRLLNRGAEDDAEFRQSITNQGRARIDLQDIARAVASVPRVTYSQVTSNDTPEVNENGLPPASVSVAVIGGDDDEVAQAVRRFVVPGINTYGNHVINTVIDTYCRTISIIRPVFVPVTLTVNVALTKDQFGCPAPSPAAIETALLSDWDATNINGKDVNAFNVRSLIESRFSNVEVKFLAGSRDGLPMVTEVDIAFIEMATLSAENLTITVI